MTVGEKLHQCLTQSESIHSQLKSFALDTQDQAAKQAFTQMADALENSVIRPLRARVSNVEAQEPTYKVFGQTQEQQGQHGQGQTRR
ncbi:MAG TPA: DUF1657 domain-containing protein [Firmicutes bacterium]|nr:DUF1657 domain-containing protein [Bacillota bacterium]